MLHFNNSIAYILHTCKKSKGGNLMMTLEEKIQQADIERKRKYPMLDITDNRNEIRAISQMTQEYLWEIRPDLKKIKVWEAIPRMVIEFIRASFTKIDKTTAIRDGESSIKIGDLFEVGVQYTCTSDGDKMGNLTPIIRCRSEFKYENVNLPVHDEVPLDVLKTMEEEKCSGLPIQFFDERKQIKDICTLAWKELDNYGISTTDAQWWLLPVVVMAFFRKTRDWLVEHKDDGEIGVEINFADLLKISVTKEGGFDDDDPVDYILSITPNQIFKKDFAKGDEFTEQNNK